MKAKSNVFTLLLLFAALIGLSVFDIEGAAIIVLIVKALLAVAIIGLIGSQITSKSEHNRRAGSRLNIETFELKMSTFLIGAPDELATALLDIKTRSLWDPSLT